MKSIEYLFEVKVDGQTAYCGFSQTKAEETYKKQIARHEKNMKDCYIEFIYEGARLADHYVVKRFNK